MVKIGEYNTLEIVKEVDFGMYLNSDMGEILLPSKYVPESAEIGDMIEVFIYKDSEDRIIATTLHPFAKVGEFACLTVKDISNAGAFMEWGLEKDLLVPHREQHKPMELGKDYIVRICLDPQTDRIIGVGKIGAFVSKNTSELFPGEEVELLIYEITDLGYMAIINEQYRGILYKNEVFQDLVIGSRVKGFIKKLREDGKVDLTLKRFGYNEVIDAKQKLLKILNNNGGILKLSDKSDPEHVKKIVNMSKKVFKKTIGALYKEGLIEIESDQIAIKQK